jgi:hypothetical protein
VIAGFLQLGIVTPATSDFGTYTGTSTLAQTGRFPVGGLISANGEYSFDVTLSPFPARRQCRFYSGLRLDECNNRVYIHADNATPTIQV